MFKKKKLFKNFKLNQLKKIKKTFKYIYFFRYNDLNINEIISLKKTLKKINYKLLILNQNLTIQFFSKLKSQGSILIIYGNNDLNLIKNLSHFTKFNLISLILQNNFFSYLKIKKILNQNHSPLNNLIVQPFLNFVYYLRKI